jgi:hypothetical protein
MKEAEGLPAFTKEEAFNYYKENYGGKKWKDHSYARIAKLKMHALVKLASTL